MFGFSSLAAVQLFQGSAQRTWDCVSQFTNLLWYKFNHLRDPIMPRSRRRHHSKSRSRSHSHDRDRDVKRRKVEAIDSPHQKRSVSDEELSAQEECSTNENLSIETSTGQEVEEKNLKNDEASSDPDELANTSQEETNTKCSDSKERLIITPKKPLTPKQLQKRAESEKRQKQKQLEREEREKKRQEEKAKKDEEKEKARLEKLKLKEEKEEQKAKEKEEKEAKRKEREEKEAEKKKEREMEKQRKQQEIDEKNKEKQKMEAQKQKAAAVFANFFVPKKSDVKVDEEEMGSLFMPFEVKSDMRLPPVRRSALTIEEKEQLGKYLLEQNEETSYLKDLKNGKKINTSDKTWIYGDDCLIVEEEIGTSICEDKTKSMKMRAKFLKFHENQRPPYYGTWRKKSTNIKGRTPFETDKIFDYEVESDLDWEEDEQGESLNGSDDDEEKEMEVEDDYEVDNEFFVPHGHLSDDEIDDEASAKLSPESLKQKLKLLKDEFDEDMKSKTNKMKPRSIGCIWYNKDGSNVDETIDRHLRPLAIITNGQIIIKKRNELISATPLTKRAQKELSEELIPAFLKLIDGNVNKQHTVVDEFIISMQNNGVTVQVSKAHLRKRMKEFAQWRKCQEPGSLYNKLCWCVEADIKKKYNIP